MAKVKVIRVKTLADYTKQVEKLLAKAEARTPGSSGVLNWYRGHSLSRTHELLPSLYRHPDISEIEPLLALEVRMMDTFMRQGMLHTFQVKDIAESRMDQLFYMQHHGVPTRLLDWTSNPFIGLYFALADARRDEVSNEYPEPAAVWVLDPFAWNRHAWAVLNWGDRGPASSDDEYLASYRPPQPHKPVRANDMYPSPISIVGTANTQRMLAQRGAFTIFGRNILPMEKTYSDENFPVGSLVKLEIEEQYIDPLLKVLLSVGYSDSVAYPDLQGLAMEIKRQCGFRT